MADCRKNIGEFLPLDGCEFESGRVVAFAFVTQEKAAAADLNPSLWEDPAFWTTETYSGDILIFQESSGGYSPATTTAPGKGTQQDRNVGTEHTLTVNVESVKRNTDFMNDLKISSNYRVAFLTDNYGTMLVGDANCRITPDLVLEDDLNSIFEWLLTVVWSDIRIPTAYTPPVGIFN